ASFEEWPLPAEPFGVVTAFDAWHWLDQEIALDKAAAALRPGGAIAIVGGEHVAGGDTNFFNEMQDCYERFMPGTPKGLRLADADRAVRRPAARLGRRPEGFELTGDVDRLRRRPPVPAVGKHHETGSGALRQPLAEVLGDVRIVGTPEHDAGTCDCVDGVGPLL